MGNILILGRNYGGVSDRVARHLKRRGHTVTRVTLYQRLLSLIHTFQETKSDSTLIRQPFDLILLHNYTDYEGKRFNEVRVIDELKKLLPFSGEPRFILLDPNPEAKAELEKDPDVTIHQGIILDYDTPPDWDIIRLLAFIETHNL